MTGEKMEFFNLLLDGKVTWFYNLLLSKFSYAIFAYLIHIEKNVLGINISYTV